MKYVLAILLLIGFVSINSCKKDDGPGTAPSACMEVSSNEVLVGETVTVTDCSKDASATEIYFGEEPFLSKSGTAEYSYKEAGTYTISVIAYPEDPRNDISKVEEVITVLSFQSGEEPTACFDYRNQLNLEVLFINCSENAATFEWDFGDGNTGTGFNPAHEYAAAGSYTVKLTAFAPGSTEGVETSSDIQVELLGDPEACFEASSDAVAPDEEISFFNCSKNSFKFEWDFGDGTGSSLINPVHTYTESGSYEVVLKAYAADGSFFASETTTINVGERYLIGFLLKSYPARNSSGETWDPELPFPLPIDGIGPEPDITIGYKRDFDANYNNTSIVYDIESSDLPYEWELGTGIKMAEDNWDFAINDDEGFFGAEEMLTWSGTLNDKGSNGVIELQLTGATLQILYEIR